MDANEQIVIAWLQQVKKMFIKSELYYGSHHADIDILAVSLPNNEIWDCEIRTRTASTNMDQKSSSEIIRKFQDDEREKVISAFVNNDDFSISKVLIISKNYLGQTEKTISKWTTKFTDEKIKALYLDDIVDELKSYSKECKKTQNPIIQAMKLS